MLLVDGNGGGSWQGSVGGCSLGRTTEGCGCRVPRKRVRPKGLLRILLMAKRLRTRAIRRATGAQRTIRPAEICGSDQNFDSVYAIEA